MNAPLQNLIGLIDARIEQLRRGEASRRRGRGSRAEPEAAPEPEGPEPSRNDRRGRAAGDPRTQEPTEDQEA